jgi:hypothetical protein
LKKIRGFLKGKKVDFIRSIVREEIRRMVREDCLKLEEMIAEEKNAIKKEEN